MSALDAFSARFDKIEENLQAFGEASEMESGIDDSNDNNTPSLPYVTSSTPSVNSNYDRNIIDHAKYVGADTSNSYFSLQTSDRQWSNAPYVP